MPAAAETSAPALPHNAGVTHSLDFRRVWHTLREKLWILVLCVVAGLLVALGYIVRSPKLYRSHLGLEVEFQEPSTVAGDETTARMRSAFLATQETLRTIEQNLTSASLLARVVRSEGLAQDEGRTLLGRSIVEDVEGRASATPAAARGRRDDEAITGANFTPIELALAAELSRMVKTGIRRGTRLIDVFVTAREPGLAQSLADAVGREYLRSATERSTGSSQETLRYLMEEEERLKRNLQKSEAAVSEYKAKTPDALQLGGGAASTGSQAGAGSTSARGGLVEDKLQELSTRLNNARAERMRFEREVQQIEDAGDNVDALLAVPGVATAPAVNERRRELAQIEAAVGTLTQRYKEKHPKMMAARAALAEAQRSLLQTVVAQPAVLRNALEQARSAEQSAQEAMQEQEKAALALNKAAIGYQELARQAESDRALYESVLRQIKATDVTKGAKTSPVTVVERPIASGRPVSPRPAMALAFGLFAGTAVGLGLIFGLDVLDRSVKTVDEAETLFHLPVLAAVPESKEGGESPQGTTESDVAVASAKYRLVSEAPEGPAAEAFRSLRATISLLGRESDRRLFLFTSAVPSEGKSFTSANYALALAQEGHRVLLIDGDLRRPNLHKIFRMVGADGRVTQIAADAPGVVDCLVGQRQVADTARRVAFGAADGGQMDATAGGELWVLAGGRRAPNPAELLAGNSFADLAKSAAGSFDRVVVDSAPVLAVSDTLLMVPHVQTACLVVRATKTPRNAVQRALALLGSAGTRPAGIILNRLPRQHGGGYYYYYSSPGYGEGTYGGDRGAANRRPVAASRGSNGAS